MKKEISDIIYNNFSKGLIDCINCKFNDEIKPNKDDVNCDICCTWNFGISRKFSDKIAEKICEIIEKNINNKSDDMISKQVLLNNIDNLKDDINLVINFGDGMYIKCTEKKKEIDKDIIKKMINEL